MLFLVKTEVAEDKVSELSEKVIRKDIKPVEGNLVFLTPDGKIGFDIVEANSESEVRSKYQQYSSYLKFHEITPIMAAGEFYEKWKEQHGQQGSMGGMGGLRQ
jgi:hypothetical protein